MRPPQNDRKAWFVWGGSSVLDGRRTRRLVSPIGALRLRYERYEASFRMLPLWAIPLLIPLSRRSRER